MSGFEIPSECMPFLSFEALENVGFKYKEIRETMAQELYSLRQAASIIGCSQASVQRTYRRAKIKGIKAGGAILVSMTQIENMRKHYDDKHANARPKNG